MADVIAALRAAGAEVYVHDPLADAAEARHEYAIELIDWDALPKADAVILAVPHRQYLEMPAAQFIAGLRDGGCVIDIKSVLDRSVLERAGWLATQGGAALMGSGFAALAYEVILTRALDMVIGSSIYSFSIILISFLVGIGGGSALASAILKARPAPVATVAVGGIIEGLALLQFVVYRTQVSQLVWAIVTLIVLLGTAIAAAWRKPLLALGVTQLLIAGGASITYFSAIGLRFSFMVGVSSSSCSLAPQPQANRKHAAIATSDPKHHRQEERMTSRLTASRAPETTKPTPEIARFIRSMTGWTASLIKLRTRHNRRMRP